MRITTLRLLTGLALLCAGISTTAQSDCTQWHLSGKFTFIRSDGRKLTVGLLRHGREISGDAYYYYKKHLYWGRLKGHIDDRNFDVTIAWQPPRRDIYEGRIDAEGYLSGTTYEEDHPGDSSTWHAQEQLHCASE